MNIEKLLDNELYKSDMNYRSNFFNKKLNELTKLHYNKCEKYKHIANSLGYSPKKDYSVNDLPFFPVRLFKQHDLMSINKEDIYKIMKSSGTSGQSVSKIYLDKKNASIQTKVLIKIISYVLGSKRLPMLVIDSQSVLSNRNSFSARAAGIIGFSIYGNKPVYALNDKMELDVDKVIQFFDQHENKEVFVFGFTYIVWQNFVRQVLDKKIKLKKVKGTLIHGGGWKKMLEESVSNKQFKSGFNEVCGIKNIINYYGMVEQTGSIFVECSNGNLKASLFSDVIIRRKDFTECGYNEIGIIQTISLLPTSYPGHNLISEDLGEQIDCNCDNSGKCFIIHGRIKEAEIRGCSDTVE